MNWHDLIICPMAVIFKQTMLSADVRHEKAMGEYMRVKKFAHIPFK
jgi:hypothetical protein